MNDKVWKTNFSEGIEGNNTNQKLYEVYKKIVVSEDDKYLLGAVLIGDASEYGNLLQFMLNKMELPSEPEGLILPQVDGQSTGLGVDALPETAQLCSCMNVTKADVVCAVSDGATNIGDIKNVTKKSLRSLMGLVTQDSILFNDSIANNLKLGKLDATDNDVIEALKIANAWEFVEDLPEDINTNIGDAGNKLSGGQKQRLSIARAVLKSPPIMVLDEATSALDTESERVVQVALENMMKNRTSIVIAHRLSTIQNADNIVVLNKGQIVEQGKHDELISKKGVYKKLVDMQSFE